MPNDFDDVLIFKAATAAAGARMKTSRAKKSHTSIWQIFLFQRWDKTKKEIIFIPEILHS